MAGVKLKNPHVVRFFISSPFNGMEKERDILTKFYWPKIEAALNTKGLHLRLVDMRWGITHSSSADAQTVNICMKEIDRSDVFIGMFGQRYGWNGRNDTDLQVNFDKATEKYPWVDLHRDKSVTELEFQHGHLNNPGNMPACFCFRDRAYDEKLRKAAVERDDARGQRNFSSEDADSFKKLEDLKLRVKMSESETIGVAMNYKDPQAGANFVYNNVWKYVENEIIAKIENPLSGKEKSDLAHKAYQTSHCGLYVGGQRYKDVLDKYILDEVSEYRPLVILGPTGSGKTTLLSNWLEEKLNESKARWNMSFFYHFVGAEPDSIKPRVIMDRILDYAYLSISSEAYVKPKDKLEFSKMAEKTQEILGKLKLEENNDKRMVFVFDCIDNIKRSKTSRPMFWLPKDLPSNVKVILSTTPGASGSIEALETLTEGDRKIVKLEICPLTEEDQKEMCARLLEENSKSMDKEQLMIVTSSPKTNNPFFLNILINELCVAGRFRQLTQQIKTLLEVDGILGLIIKVLERIQEDYSQMQYSGNVVEEVLCALCLCEDGISESEFPLARHVWAPVIYALGAFLTDRGGMLGFAFPQMNQAVELLYMSTEEKRQAMAKQVSEIFYDQYRACLKNQTDVKFRTASELLHLTKISGDRHRMIQILGDIRIFETVYVGLQYKLNDYWQWLGTLPISIAHRYIRSLESYVADRFSACLENYEMDQWNKVLQDKSSSIQRIRSWFEDSKFFHGLAYLFDKEMAIDSNRPGLGDINRQNCICTVKYQKACFLSDIEKYEEALTLHMEVLESRKKLISAKAMDKENAGLSYHGIGLCYFNMKNYVESEIWYKKALQVQKDEKFKMQQSSTYCNLGLISLHDKKFDEALKLFEKSNVLLEEAEPNTLSLRTAYNYHNIGLVYRKKSNFDLAEKFYSKSLKLKEAILGRESFDVALSIMNIGTLEVYRKNHAKALEFAREALMIFEVLAPEGSYRTVMAKENVVNQLTVLNRYDEAEPLFTEVRAFLKTMDGGSSNGLGPLHRRFIKWYLKKDNYEDAADIAFELTKSTKAKPQDYAHLALCDANMPAEERLVRPENSTLDFAYKKWPTNHDILMTKISIILDGKEPAEQFNEFVLQHCETDTTQETNSRYMQVADIVKDDIEDLNKAIEVLEGAMQKHPSNEAFETKLEEFQGLNKSVESKEQPKQEPDEQLKKQLSEQLTDVSKEQPNEKLTEQQNAQMNEKPMKQPAV